MQHLGIFTLSLQWKSELPCEGSRCALHGHPRGISPRLPEANLSNVSEVQSNKYEKKTKTNPDSERNEEKYTPRGFK